MMIYFKWRVSSFAHSLKSLHPFIPAKQPHVTNADKNLATWGRIQGDERWWWSTSNEECHLLLTLWNQFIPSSPQSIPTSLIWTKTCPPEVAFKATKDDDDLLQMKSVIFCWLSEVAFARGLENEINGFLNCLKRVFSSCRIHFRTAIPDRELEHPCLCHFTKPIQIRIYIRSISSSVWLQNYNTEPQCHSHAKCKWCSKMGRDWVV